MKNIDSFTHVRGESVFVDDVLISDNTLFAVVFTSPIASGRIVDLQLKDALNSEGIECIITANDIPGENQIGRIIPDEVLLTNECVDFIGQPIAVILAKTEFQAKVARSKIEAIIEPSTPVIDPREAYVKGKIILEPSISEMGDVDEVWPECDVVVTGTVEIGGQEHLYIETQGAYAFPVEKGGIKVISSTQAPTSVQSTIARILNISMHKVEVEVRRLGGGFGGKEDQATAWACLAALGSFVSKKPVKLILDRIDDMKMTGKRNPYSVDYKMGLTKSGKILGYEILLYQNAGAAADLSPPVLGRTMFHSTNSYFIPNVRVKGICCKTNLPPNTAFRGFGGPQGMFVIESALDHAAQELKINKWKLQKLNLLENGNEFHYGQIVKNTKGKITWEEAENKFNFAKQLSKVNDFNLLNTHSKKGISIMPVCFGLSFTKTSLNQAGALVNIYFDGSIGVSTGAVEMGQGVNTRILQVPTTVFSIPQHRVKIETTNTTRVINTSPSAASATHDLNGKATEIACMKILKRLRNVVAKKFNKDDPLLITIKEEMVYYNKEPLNFSWNDLVKLAYANRINLAAHGYYVTPDVHFNLATQKGSPFAYHVYGTAIIEVTIDCLRGIYEIDSIKIVHDSGKQMNEIIDLGQIEGGVVQGIGWMTSEEVVYDQNGQLSSNTLSTYKIPDIYAAPKKIQTHFLKNSETPLGLFKSKANGEPPLMYGIGVYFAIKNAIKSFNPNSTIGYNTPITPEKVLLALYDNYNPSN